MCAKCGVTEGCSGGGGYSSVLERFRYPSNSDEISCGCVKRISFHFLYVLTQPRSTAARRLHAAHERSYVARERSYVAREKSYVARERSYVARERSYVARGET